MDDAQALEIVRFHARRQGDGHEEERKEGAGDGGDLENQVHHVPAAAGAHSPHLGEKKSEKKE